MSSISLADAQRRMLTLGEDLAQSLIGQSELISGLLQALLANGHVLIEGVPGLGKTRGVMLLASACGGTFRRLQFTPDLLPADLLGTEIYSRDSGRFETKKGPVFAPFVLADEINRAAPKVQSALLEAMQERQVTLGDETFPLPAPFLVFATQNPVEQEGTYPLPEAQVDRFLLKLRVTYPSRKDEVRMVEKVLAEHEAPRIEKALTPEEILDLQERTQSTFTEERILEYAVALTHATRHPRDFGLDVGSWIRLGASPRASLALVRVGKANALLSGRDHVQPEDIQAAAKGVLRHRLLLTYHAEAEGVRPEDLIEKILETVPVP